MAKNNISFDEKLKKLEEQKNLLLEERRKEILKIIEATGSISISDRILAGCLLFLKDNANKNHPILDEFEFHLKSIKTAKAYYG